MALTKKSAARPAVASEPGKGARSYGGWFEDIVQRLQIDLGTLPKLDNLEIGHEFEIAMCHALQRLLPARCGVCRGWVVEYGGVKQGDDIIVYDAARFPTLRALGRDLAARERVPAEAVLAYIEVKHTLYARARDARSQQKGQSLAKACEQVARVKALRRAAVPLEIIPPRTVLPEGSVEQRRGLPRIRNPWYGAVWALHLVVDPELKANPADGVARRVADVLSAGMLREHLPDVIAAASVMMSPAVCDAQGNHNEARPFITPETDLLFTNGVHALGAAMVHLAWAIEEIALGELPWMTLLHEELVMAERRSKKRSVLIDAPRPRWRRRAQP